MNIIQPEVHLVTGTADPLATIYRAYRRCYTPGTGVPQAASTAEMSAFVRRMLRADHPHESPLEHASFTFHVACSRTCSHQFVRHRLASYSQLSQRYVNQADGGLDAVLPPSIAGDRDLRCGALMHFREAEGMYGALIAQGVPAEDARAILPQGTATAFFVTMNCRELRHFFSERCCHRAQAEIRGLAEAMLAACRDVLPAVFEHAGPPCLRAGKCVELVPCGDVPWRAVAEVPSVPAENGDTAEA